MMSPNGRWEWVAQDDGNLVRRDRLGLVPDRGICDAIGAPLWPIQESPTPDPSPSVPERVQGFGISYYTAHSDPDCDDDEWANRTRDAGSQHTRIFLFDAWANGRLEAGIGMYAGVQPWLLTGSQFDLSRVSEAYLDSLDSFVTAFHRTGQHVCLSLLEMYTWSQRKSGLLWVPNRNLQPTRNNIQGVRWGDPDDDTWLESALPDDVLSSLLVAVLMVIGDRWRGVTFEVGNELPEKGLHYRMRDVLRSLGWQGRIQVNRNEDTPSQYDNMRISQDWDALAIHGRESIAYLDEDFGDEQHAFRTFRDADESGTINPSRFGLSSDGVGNNTAPPYFDEDALVEVASYARSQRYFFEHQAREIKLGRFTLGRLDLNDLNVGLCRRLAGG